MWKIKILRESYSFWLTEKAEFFLPYLITISNKTYNFMDIKARKSSHTIHKNVHNINKDEDILYKRKVNYS